MWIILLIMGSILIIVNVRALKKEENNKFNEVLKEKSLKTKDYEAEFLKLKDDYEKTKINLENNIKALQSEINKLNDLNKLKEDNKKSNNDFKINKLNSKITDNKNESNNIKVLEIKRLLKEGFTIDDIAEKLDIGKGEVILIKELYIK